MKVWKSLLWIKSRLSFAGCTKLSAWKYRQCKLVLFHCAAVGIKPLHKPATSIRKTYRNFLSLINILIKIYIIPPSFSSNHSISLNSNLLMVPISFSNGWPAFSYIIWYIIFIYIYHNIYIVSVTYWVYVCCSSVCEFIANLLSWTTH